MALCMTNVQTILDCMASVSDLAWHLLEQFPGTHRNLSAELRSWIESHRLTTDEAATLRKIVCGTYKWKRLLEYICEDSSWELLVKAWEGKEYTRLLTNNSIPRAVRASCPDAVYNLFASSFGEQHAFDTFVSLNAGPRNTLRANRIKATRSKLLDILGTNVAQPCLQAPDGIELAGRLPSRNLVQFEQGYFEWQDEASQLVAALVKPTAQDVVLDYCAGAGGKTLAIASSIWPNKADHILHDVRSSAMRAARRRLARAGVDNFEYFLSGDLRINKYHGRVNWLLLDVPCTGIGAWRRDPSRKWDIDDNTITDVVELQKEIFDQAFSYIKPTGLIIYSTCSLLRQENEDQVHYFCQKYKLSLVEEPYRSQPTRDMCDGLFGAVLQHSSQAN